MNSEVMNYTQGTLSLGDCELLAQLASDVPSNGTILDLNCGNGRSTITMALALRENKRGTATIIAVDSHITNPLSINPYKEGSIMTLLESLRHFQVSSWVIPVISPVHTLSRLVDKRSANMVVIQSPATMMASFSEDVMIASMELSKDAIRRGGSILVCCPNPVYRPQFDRLLTQQFNGMPRVVTGKPSEIVVFRYE